MNIKHFCVIYKLCSLIVVVKANADYSNQQDGYRSEEADDYNEFFTARSAATETVSEFLSKFQTLAAPSADVGASMNRISLEADAFLKLGFPVGSLVAGSLHIATKPKSDESQALLLLKDTMEARFNEIRRTIGVAGKAIGMGLKLHDYVNRVHLPMVNLQRQFDYYLSPNFDKSAEDVQHFKEMCFRPTQNKGTPLGILDYIHMHTVKRCKNGGLSQQQLSRLAEFVPLLRKFRTKLDNDIVKEHFDQMSPELSIWMTQLENNAAKKLLRRISDSIDICSTYYTARDAFDQLNSFFVETGTAPRQFQWCLLQDIITGKHYHRKAIEEMENILRLDVLQLMVFTSICANITFGESQARMDWYQTTISKRARDIIVHVQSYVDTELENSFPQIEMGVVKSIVDELNLQKTFINNLTIIDAKSEIFNTLQLFGNRKYARQGFVSESLEIETNFIARCPPKNCFILQYYNYVNVMVTRYEIGIDDSRVLAASDWLYGKGNRATFLRNFIEQNYNIDRVSDLLVNFESQYFHLTHTEFYHNLAILRNFGQTDRCGIIAASSEYRMEFFSATRIVQYYFEGSIWHACESFLVYFFV